MFRLIGFTLKAHTFVNMDGWATVHQGSMRSSMDPSTFTESIRVCRQVRRGLDLEEGICQRYTCLHISEKAWTC